MSIGKEIISRFKKELQNEEHVSPEIIEKILELLEKPEEIEDEKILQIIKTSQEDKNEN